MRYLPKCVGCRDFLNADLIAVGLSPFDPDSQAVQAGRLMLSRMEELSNRAETFAIETTLAGRTHFRRLQRMKSELGYLVELVFVWLPNADFAIQRVANRVRQGGHNIPTPTIQRRFEQGIANFKNHFVSLADRWGVLDGSSYPASPIVFGETEKLRLIDKTAYATLKSQTPALLGEFDFDSPAEASEFISNLESAANETTRTIIDAASRVPAQILTWRNGQVVLVDPVTERFTTSQPPN
ncbi:hypothetical protein LOC70_02500 [Rhodopirellula sp. JC737]|nr:hypothetical protein [Rhodopirellula sp. JC737]